MQRLSELFSVFWNTIGFPRLAAWPLLAVPIVVIVFAVLVLTHHMETGFAGRNAWDWIEVVGVPLAAVVVGGWFAVFAQRAGQYAREQGALDAERARETTLREYLDRMSDLVLSHKLQECGENSPARALAQARTLGALRSLNGPRKGILVRFLHESKLIERNCPVIRLEGADLTNSDLSFSDLHGCDLGGANLRDADFLNADLGCANLGSSVADREQLIRALDLIGAAMPDGTEMSEEEWHKIKAGQDSTLAG